MSLRQMVHRDGAFAAVAGIAAGLAVWLLLWGTPATAAACIGEPLEAVRRPIQEAVRILTDSRYQGADKRDLQQKQLQRILEQGFDFLEFSRRVLAEHWHAFTPGQRNEFVQVFTEFLSRFYLGRLQQHYTTQQIRYYGQSRLSADRAAVDLAVVWEEVEIPVEIRLLSRTGCWRTYDIVALGISAVQNYRAQFDEILSRHSPAEVIAMVRKRVDEN